MGTERGATPTGWMIHRVVAAEGQPDQEGSRCAVALSPTDW